MSKFPPWSPFVQESRALERAAEAIIRGSGKSADLFAFRAEDEMDLFEAVKEKVDQISGGKIGMVKAPSSDGFRFAIQGPCVYCIRTSTAEEPSKRFVLGPYGDGVNFNA